MTDLVPVIKAVLAEFVPTVQEAIEWIQGRVPGRRHNHTIMVLRRPRRVVEPHAWRDRIQHHH
jgi:hypothetical protein